MRDCKHKSYPVKRRERSPFNGLALRPPPFRQSCWAPLIVPGTKNDRTTDSGVESPRSQGRNIHRGRTPRTVTAIHPLLKRSAGRSDGTRCGRTKLEAARPSFGPAEARRIQRGNLGKTRLRIELMGHSNRTGRKQSATRRFVPASGNHVALRCSEGAAVKLITFTIGCRFRPTCRLC